MSNKGPKFAFGIIAFISTIATWSMTPIAILPSLTVSTVSAQETNQPRDNGASESTAAATSSYHAANAGFFADPGKHPPGTVCCAGGARMRLKTQQEKDAWPKVRR